MLVFGGNNNYPLIMRNDYWNEEFEFCFAVNLHQSRDFLTPSIEEYSTIYQTVVTGMVKGPTLIIFNLMKSTHKTRPINAPPKGKQ